MRALLLPLLLSAYGVLLPAQGKKCFCGSGSCAETALGTVCGKTEQASSGAGLLPSSMEVDAFYGVRYATIPRRFAPADVANATYPLPYQAIQPAPDCVGNSGVDKPRAGPSPKNHSHQGTIYSEDCLFVNIKRPTGVDAGDDLPVMVWIHGGGMMGGDDNMDFSRLVATQQIVLVNGESARPSVRQA
jgi:carboxylesterase type B